jgi:hypothetical protein
MKKLSNTAKVLKYLRRRPNEKASVIAKATGVSIQTVYQVKHMRKKDMALEMSKPSTVFLSKSSPKKEVKDNVNHPAHYKTGGIETIDFIEAKSLSYNLGNVVKYITRADYKGNKLEDLKKAQWYLNREVSNLTK